MKNYYIMFSSVVLVLVTRTVLARDDDGKCVKLGVELCRDLNYNMTLIPNVKMNVDKMDEASRRVSEFSPLFKINCYENLKYFICNMFLPICHTINGNPTPVYPCRHVCEAARAGCEPLMKKYSFDWPEVLHCDFLARIDERNALCGSPPAVRPSPQTTTPIIPATNIPNLISVVQKFPNSWIRSLNEGSNWQRLLKFFQLNPKTPYSVELICKSDPNSVYIKKDNKEYCPSRCEHFGPFTKADLKFATVWISTWSIICFLSTALTVSTFLIDHKRFKYPERPIIFLSFCYNLYSIGYLIRVFGGYSSVICEKSEDGKHVVIEGMSVTSCTLVFFFLYFFGMASALWWVILALTWFLSAALKWGHEAIEKYSSLFHAISWTVPTIQTIVALVTRKIDADKLSGLCFIGNNDSKDLLLFVALPLLIYLLLGTLFLCMGFIALLNIRKVLRRERNTNKFERLMLRIGVFSVLYSVPASIVVGCFIHEYNRLKAVEDRSKDLLSCMTNPQCVAHTQPKVELFFLRYFMLLVVGVTSGAWIWTSKTLNSWKKFYDKRRGNDRRQKPEEKKQLQKKQKPYTHHHQQQQQNAQRVRRTSNDGLNQGSIVPSTVMTTLHGSNHNMQQQIYMPPQQPPRFFYPIPQNAASFMQAHNVPVAQAKIDNTSRGYTVTPMSNLTSDNDDNSQFNYQSNNHNYISPYSTGGEEFMNPPPSSKAYSRSNSDHHSMSQHSSQHNGDYHSMSQHSSQPNGSLPRTTRTIEQPGSPKSVSTSRSHRSNDENRL